MPIRVAEGALYGNSRNFMWPGGNTANLYLKANNNVLV
jgi:membrane-bound inhibitor of C-type lysozyme